MNCNAEAREKVELDCYQKALETDRQRQQQLNPKSVVAPKKQDAKNCPS